MSAPDEAYDADDVADADAFDPDYDDEGYGEDDYDFERPEGSSFLDGTIFGGRVPRKIAFPAFGAIAVVVIILLAALTTDGFGFGTGVERVSIVMLAGDTAEFKPETESVELEVYLSRTTFGKMYQGDADVTVSYEGGDKTKLPAIGLNDLGRGRGTYPYETFFQGNGEYTFTVSADGKSDARTREIQKSAADVMPTFYFSENNTDDYKHYMRVSISLIAYEGYAHGEAPLADIVATDGSGTIIVYYDENDGSSPDLEDAEEIIEIEFTTTSTTISYDGGGDIESIDSFKGGSYSIEFTDNHIKNENNDGNYTIDVTFVNSFGEDPDTEEKTGFYHGSDDYEDDRRWMNYLNDFEYSDE